MLPTTLQCRGRIIHIGGSVWFVLADLYDLNPQAPEGIVVALVAPKWS